MKHLILVLGAPNDEHGNLSHIARTRLECALNLYKNNDDTYFLCTGGFGAQFNTTKYPHAYYAKKYLISKGANESDFPQEELLPLIQHEKQAIQRLKDNNYILY